MEGFDWREVLGFGITGLTLRVRYNKNTDYAIKMMFEDDYGNAERETKRCHQLNKISGETCVFTKTVGWCGKTFIPAQCRKKIDMYRFLKRPPVPSIISDLLDKKDDDDSRIIYLVMEHISHTSLEVVPKLTIGELVGSLFMLLHGIAVARRTFECFKHRDIHEKNIMFAERLGRDRSPITCVTSTGKKYVVSGMRFLPKLIDFGEARLSQKECADDNLGESWEAFFESVNPNDKDKPPREFHPRSDMVRLKLVFREWFRDNRTNFQRDQFEGFVASKLFEDAMYSERNEHTEIEALLEHDYFKQWITEPATTTVESKKRIKL